MTRSTTRLATLRAPDMAGRSTWSSGMPAAGRMRQAGSGDVEEAGRDDEVDVALLEATRPGGAAHGR